MNRPAAVHSDGTKLYVADFFNNRILVWNTFPTSGGQPADYALGQPAGAHNLDSNSSNQGGITGASLWQPQAVWGTGSRLFVSDTVNARVLVWNTPPSAGGQPADFALGRAAGAGNLTSAPSYSAPSGVEFFAPTLLGSDGTCLFLSDRSSHRVLVWNALPTTGGQSADYVLGQPSGLNNLTASEANHGGRSGTTLNYPIGMASDGTRLFIADAENHRVLTWRTVPSGPGIPADFALGQPTEANLTVDVVSNPSTSTANFWFPPASVYSDGIRLFVADKANHRVLVWSTLPTSSTQPADFALGQPPGADNLTSTGSNTGGISASSMCSPNAVSVHGERLYVADSDNHRILVWNHLPTAGGTPADFALGQPPGADNLTSVVVPPGPPTAFNLSYPAAVLAAGQHLFVSDPGNHRVLVWDGIPAGPAPAAFALGQPGDASNLTSGADSPTASASTLKGPHGIAVASDHLYIADATNHRILVWNTLPSKGGTPADFALGQPAGTDNLTATAANNAGVSAHALARPTKIAADASGLYVVDAANHRILVWSPLPTAAGADATAVIGQTTFTEHQANGAGATSPTTLHEPTDVTWDDTRLFIADSLNHRVLIMARD